jgi:hypothetical protein
MIYNNDKLIAAAFVKARAAIGGTVGKDAKGNYGKYATLAAITDVITAPLAAHGLAVIQEAQLDETGVTVETTLLHESGATMQFAPLTMPLTNRTPQAVGSCITYGRRYALAAICGLAPDDDDGQAAQDAQPAPQRAQAAQASKPTRAAAATSQRAPVQATGKPAPVTDEQLEELNALGEVFYGDKWEAQQTKLVEAVTKGAVSEVEKLLAQDAQKLIEGIQKKMAPVNLENVAVIAL